MRPDLVIFDCDGVLVDSEWVSARVLSANLAGYGLDLTAERCMEVFIGGTMAGVMEMARALGAALHDDWVAEIYGLTYAALRQGVEPVVGIPDLLLRLDAEGIAHCVASNGSDEKMDITLGRTGLAARFAGRRFSAHAVGIAKPDPGLFRHAARVMGADPARCLVVEDSPTGVEAARRAGMRCLGYAPHGDGARLAALGAEIVRDMAEVPARLGLGPAAP
jgi:HAD superfamily hydrolase (TIGR01509 family)